MRDPGGTPMAEPEREVREALRSEACTAPLAEARLVFEPGGLSNHAWIAETGAEKFFVRLNSADAARLGVDRHSECALLRVVAAAGIAPAVVRCAPGQRLLVTRHIPGETLDRDRALDARQIERLALALRRLHGLPVPDGIVRVDFAAQAGRLEAQCQGAREVSADLRSKARRALALLERGARADTLCHNDLHHLNLIFTPDRVWFVDWEYGGVGDPVFDFASFLCQHDCGMRERELLRRAYGDGAIEAGQLTAACWAFDYVQWLWYRAWPAGRGASPVYAERAAAIEQRLRERDPF